MSQSFPPLPEKYVTHELAVEHYTQHASEYIKLGLQTLLEYPQNKVTETPYEDIVTIAWAISYAYAERLYREHARAAELFDVINEGKEKSNAG